MKQQYCYKSIVYCLMAAAPQTGSGSAAVSASGSSTVPVQEPRTRGGAPLSPAGEDADATIPRQTNELLAGYQGRSTVSWAAFGSGMLTRKVRLTRTPGLTLFRLNNNICL